MYPYLDEATDRHGLINIHTTEPGRGGVVVHRWQVRSAGHFETGQGVALTAIENANPQQGRGGRILLKIMGIETSQDFELHNVTIHRQPPSGSSPVEGQRTCTNT